MGGYGGASQNRGEKIVRETKAGWIVFQLWQARSYSKKLSYHIVMNSASFLPTELLEHSIESALQQDTLYLVRETIQLCAKPPSSPHEVAPL